MKKRNDGFTLVELLAVIVILALLLIIVIPQILETTNRAKKELFYDYSRSVQSKAVAKYIQEMDDETIKSSCRVYDISTDLDLENTGDFEGWAKVNRKISDKNGVTKGTARISLPTVEKVLGVKYCIADGTSCTPNTDYQYEEGAKQVTILKNINQGQVLCAYEIYPESGATKNTSTSCKTFNEIAEEDRVGEYEYEVIITIKDRERAVNNINFNDNTSKDDFYKAIDDFKEAAKSKKVNPMAIASPTCNASDPVTYKGTTTIKNATKESTSSTTKKGCPTLSTEDNSFEIILNPNGGVLTKGTTINQCADCSSSEDIETPTREGYIFDGWYYDKAFSKRITGSASNRVEKEANINASGCVTGYNRVYLYAKWVLDESKTTTPPEQSTVPPETTDPNNTTPPSSVVITTEPTTSRDINDDTLKLNSLTVSGYDIGFSPMKFDYRVEVPFSQTSIGVSASAKTPAVTDVSIDDTNNLGVGNNVILVNLTNHETNKSSYYRVVVVRLDEGGKAPTQGERPEQPEWDPSSGLPDPSLDESNASLRYLQISGYDFSFDPNNYSYDLNVATLDPLGISYQTAVKGAYVTIIGNENLSDGSEIEVAVVSLNGFYNKRYKITIRYNKAESTGTRYLRNLAIVLGIILAVILVIARSNKTRGKRIIKKKDDKNPQEQTQVPQPIETPGQVQNQNINQGNTPM